MSGSKLIKVILGAETAEFILKFKEAEEHLGKMEAESSRVGKAMSAGFAVGAVGLAALAYQLKEGVAEAVRWDTANQKLASTVKAAGMATAPLVKAIDESAEALQRRTGISKLDTVAADDMIARNQRVAQTLLGSNKAVEETNTVLADMARRMGVDDVAAAAALGRALANPEKAAGALRKAKIYLTDAQNNELKALVKGGKGAEAQAKLFEDLKGQVSGAADAYGKTLPGKLEIAKQSFGQVREELSAKLIPALSTAADKLIAFSDWASQHKPEVQDMATAIFAISTALVAAKGAQIAFNAVTKANPWVALGAAVIAVGTWIYVMRNKSQKAADALYYLEQAAAFLAATLHGVYEIVAGITELFVGTVLQTVKLVAEAIGGLGAGIGKVGGFLAKIPGPTQAAMRAVQQGGAQISDSMSGVANAMQNAQNTSFGAINSVNGVFSAVESLHGKQINILADTSQAIQAMNALKQAQEAATGKLIGPIIGPESGRPFVPHGFGGPIPTQSFVTTPADVFTGGGGGGGGGGGSKAAKKLAAAKTVVAKTGQEIFDAFLGGLQSRYPTVAASLQSFSDKMAIRLGHGLDAVVSKTEKSMDALQKSMDSMATRIERAQQALDDAKSTQAEFTKSVRDSIVALGDLGTHGGENFDVIKDRIQQSLDNARLYAKTMAALKSAGLDPEALKTLIASGPGNATQTGQAILAAGGAGIAQLNTLEAQLRAVGAATGATEGSQFYKAGVTQAQGVLDGLKSQDAKLKAQMTSLGKTLAAAVLQGLNLKTTSSGLKVAGKRAFGGGVRAGSTYLVGENGPEYMTAGADGFVTPGGGSMSVHIHATGPTLQDIVQVEIKKSNRAVANARRAGASRSFA